MKMVKMVLVARPLRSHQRSNRTTGYMDSAPLPWRRAASGSSCTPRPTQATPGGLSVDITQQSLRQGGASPVVGIPVDRSLPRHVKGVEDVVVRRVPVACPRPSPRSMHLAVVPSGDQSAPRPKQATAVEQTTTVGSARSRLPAGAVAAGTLGRAEAGPRLREVHDASRLPGPLPTAPFAIIVHGRARWPTRTPKRRKGGGVGGGEPCHRMLGHRPQPRPPVATTTEARQAPVRRRYQVATLALHARAGRLTCPA